MTRLVTCIALVAGMFLASVSGAEAQEVRLTPAQTLLFDGNHLEDVAPNTVLNYRFVRTGGGGSFSDTVKMIVGEASANGGKDLDFEFLSGARRMPANSISGFHNNAIIMLFLQHDVVELQRRTGGPSLYFRNRIRDAFAGSAALKSVMIAHDGKTLRATEVAVIPFADKLPGAQFEQLARRSYRFVLSDQIPGQVYQIQSTTWSKTGDRPLDRTTMTFAAAERRM